MAYASRGGNTKLDWNRCDLQDEEAFLEAADFDHQVAPGESARVHTLFENWLAANAVDEDTVTTDEEGEALDPDAEIKAAAERNNEAGDWAARGG